MKVYSLLGFIDYEGSDLVGVYGSLEDLMERVKSRKWFYDDMGYVESELGQQIDVLEQVEYVEFLRDVFVEVVWQGR